MLQWPLLPPPLAPSPSLPSCCLLSHRDSQWKSLFQAQAIWRRLRRSGGGGGGGSAYAESTRAREGEREIFLVHDGVLDCTLSHTVCELTKHSFWSIGPGSSACSLRLLLSVSGCAPTRSLTQRPQTRSVCLSFLRLLYALFSVRSALRLCTTRAMAKACRPKLCAMPSDRCQLPSAKLKVSQLRTTQTTLLAKFGSQNTKVY